MVRVDIVDDDAGIAELCPTQHHLQPVDQRGVAAPVHPEGLLLSRGLRGTQVGNDVATAEGVDRLLRVPDEHQRGDTGEGAVDHLPLHRVGVLELIDHHDRPAPAHPRPRRRVSGFQGIGQPAEQIVIAEDAGAAFTDLQLGLDRARELHTDGGVGLRLGVARPQLGRGVVDHFTREGERMLVVQRRCVGEAAEAGEVEVVDDLGDEFVEALLQFHPRIGVAGYSQ